jgi:hypothetical protein
MRGMMRCESTHWHLAVLWYLSNVMWSLLVEMRWKMPRRIKRCRGGCPGRSGSNLCGTRHDWLKQLLYDWIVHIIARIIPSVIVN